MISSMTYKPMKTKKYKNTFLIERLSSLKISKLIKNIKNRPILNQISKSVPNDLRSGESGKKPKNFKKIRRILMEPVHVNKIPISFNIDSGIIGKMRISFLTFYL